MTKPLKVLITTYDNDANPETKDLRERMTSLLPEGTEIHYGVYGYAEHEKRGKQADLREYNLVMMSGEMADHFGTPTVVDKKYKKPRKKQTIITYRDAC